MSITSNVHATMLSGLTDMYNDIITNVLLVYDLVCTQADNIFLYNNIILYVHVHVLPVYTCTCTCRSL